MPSLIVNDADGNSHNLADFHGHAVLLNLWASWCGPCVEEMPSLDALQSIMGAGNLTVIALDQERDAADETRLFFKRHSISHLQIYSDPTGHVASLLHAHGLPVSYLINAKGQLIGRVNGIADWSSPDAIKFLREVIGKNG